MLTFRRHDKIFHLNPMSTIFFAENRKYEDFRIHKSVLLESKRKFSQQTEIGMNANFHAHFGIFAKVLPYQNEHCIPMLNAMAPLGKALPCIWTGT